MQNCNLRAFHHPYIACSDSIYSVHCSMCYIASIFHVLTHFRLQHIMLQTFQTTSKVPYVVVFHSVMPLKLMDSLYLPSLPLLSYLDGLKPYYCNKFSFETFDVISVWLLLCYKSSSTVRVSISNPGMTLMHRDWTVWGLVARGFSLEESILWVNKLLLSNW